MPTPPSATAPGLLRPPSAPRRHPSPLLRPAPLPGTPPAPSRPPHPPPSCSSPSTLFPRSPPHLSTPSRPSRTDFTRPGVSACSGGGEQRGQRGEEASSAGHGGRRQGEHAGVRGSRASALGSPPPPGSNTGRPAFQPLRSRPLIGRGAVPLRHRLHLSRAGSVIGGFPVPPPGSGLAHWLAYPGVHFSGAQHQDLGPAAGGLVGEEEPKPRRLRFKCSLREVPSSVMCLLRLRQLPCSTSLGGCDHHVTQGM